MSIYNYDSAPDVRWLGVGPDFLAAMGGTQPPQVGVWSDLLTVTDGKVVAHPTMDGTDTGQPLFERLIACSLIRFDLAGMGGAGDDADPETGATSFVLVDVDPSDGIDVVTVTFEVATWVAGVPTFADDGVVCFLTLHGVAAEAPVD